jgi:hypothetical protein
MICGGKSAIWSSDFAVGISKPLECLLHGVSKVETRERPPSLLTGEVTSWTRWRSEDPDLSQSKGIVENSNQTDLYTARLCHHLSHRRCDLPTPYRRGSEVFE